MADLANRLLRPRVVFPLLAIVLLATVLFAPHREVAEYNPRFSTRSSEPDGAKGLAGIYRRLGWKVEQRLTLWNAGPPLDTNAIYLIPSPLAEYFTAAEAHALLVAVRRGASLVIVPAGSLPLADSLRIAQSGWRTRRILGDSASLRLNRTPPGKTRNITATEIADSVARTRSRDTTDIGAADSLIRATSPFSGFYSKCGRGVLEPMYGPVNVGHAVNRLAPIPGDTTLVWTQRLHRTEPAVLGFPYGKGRVVAVADEDMLRNDVIRLCDKTAGFRAVQLMAWASRGTMKRIVFDEYHQGYGRHASLTRVMGLFLTENTFGRALLGLIAAAFLLLLATAPRPLHPRSHLTLERRSPLEHVGALSRAYEQIGATRTATRRLIRGLRRRVSRGAWRGSDEQFLQALAERHPRIRPDVQRLLRATREQLPSGEMLAVAAAIDHIERTIAT